MTWALIPPYDKQNRAIQQIMLTADDRVVAVLGGTLLADAVRRTLKERFRDDDEVASKLLEMDRPLSNLRPQIDTLYLLGAFDSQTRLAMRAVAYIRNAFAHELELTFDSTEKTFVKERARLILHEGKSVYPHHLYGPDSDVPIEEASTNRLRFVVNLKLCLIALMRDRLSHEPYSNSALTEEQKQQRHGPLREAQDRELKAQRESFVLNTATSMFVPGRSF